MRRWRKMTWALLIWSALIIVWMVVGGGGAANDCVNQTGDGILSAQEAQDACQTGAGIGIALIALIGFFGFAFLSIIWFMTRPKTRSCPRCGEDVKKGRMECKACGYDFRTLGADLKTPAEAPMKGATG